MSKERLKDALVALSLANLAMTRVWDYLWGTRLNSNRYFLERPLAERIHVAIAGCLVFALLLWLLAKATRRPGRIEVVGRAGVLLFAVVAVNGIRQTQPGLSTAALQSRFGTAGLVWSSAVLLGVALLALHGFGLRRLSSAAVRLALAMSPLALLTLGVAASVARSDARIDYKHKLSVPRLPGSATTRVLFLVFDGLDQDLMVTHRPGAFHAAEFDRLAQTSTSWDNAYPPSNTTLVSLPALITGRLLDGVEPISPNDALLKENGHGRSVRWSEAETLFTRARKLGVNSH